jgi:hypothetical protein
VGLYVEGKVGRSAAVVHAIVKRFESLDERARALASVSRNFHRSAQGRADGAAMPASDPDGDPLDGHA